MQQALQTAEYVPGIITDMDNNTYHSHHAISSTDIKLVMRSLYHYHSEKINDDPELKKERTKALNIGTAFHILALEPEKFDKYIAVDPDDYPTKKECGRTIEDQRAEFCAKHPGKIILKAKDIDDKKRGMAKAIRNDAAARYLLQGKGLVESSLFAIEPTYNIECKIRPDWLRDDDLIVDLKSAEDASDEAFDRSIWNYKYHVSAAFYMDIFEQVKGRKAAGFVLLPVESKPPYAVGNPVLLEEGDDWINIGRKSYFESLQKLSQAFTTKKYPAYGSEIRKSMPKPWMNNLTN